jgi:transcriptional regulator with XRE-family HTH domain
MPRRKHAKVDPTIALAARFAQQLAALRADRGETQKQLATRLGMTESMISRLENGEHLPSLRTLCRIAAGFDRTLEVDFHEHEHAHSGGVRHSHVRDHDSTHTHGHGEK